MIVFTCPNCNRVAVLKDCNAAGLNIQCRCEAAYRISVVSLREGKKVVPEPVVIETSVCGDLGPSNVKCGLPKGHMSKHSNGMQCPQWESRS